VDYLPLQGQAQGVAASIITNHHWGEFIQGGLKGSHEDGELVWRMIEHIKILRTKWNDKLLLLSLSIIKQQR
jgi:hypothetical protein